jgi:hypothetical protein
MTPHRRGWTCLALLLVGLWPAVASAEDVKPPPPSACPCRPSPGVACWAVPSDTGHYIGYPVGGGCLCRGAAPAPGQGTWG